MQAFTCKFKTTKVDYDLLKDLETVRNKIKDHVTGDINDKFVLHAHITVIVDSPTRIGFSYSDPYQDMMFDTIYDSYGYDSFSGVRIIDRDITGTITIKVA